jgi:DNA uptake protein ComE-like DNA-binding protein
VEQLKPARAQMVALVDRVTEQAAALGPALWLATTQPLVLKLDTTEADQLAALDRSLAEWAENIVAERDAHGPYGSLSDLVQRVGLPAPLAAKLSDMAAVAITLGTYSRL